MQQHNQPLAIVLPTDISLICSQVTCGAHGPVHVHREPDKSRWLKCGRIWPLALNIGKKKAEFDCDTTRHVLFVRSSVHGRIVDRSSTSTVPIGHVLFVSSPQWTEAHGFGLALRAIQSSGETWKLVRATSTKGASLTAQSGLGQDIKSFLTSSALTDQDFIPIHLATC